MGKPTVFISYSQDSDSHNEWVRKLAEDLKRAGIEPILDQTHLSLGQDITKFMADGITTADRVLVVCSENYVQRAESRV